MSEKKITPANETLKFDRLEIEEHHEESSTNRLKTPQIKISGVTSPDFNLTFQGIRETPEFDQA